MDSSLQVRRKVPEEDAGPSPSSAKGLVLAAGDAAHIPGEDKTAFLADLQGEEEEEP